jgi:hypothetical protein
MARCFPDTSSMPTDGPPMSFNADEHITRHRMEVNNREGSGTCHGPPLGRSLTWMV